MVTDKKLQAEFGPAIGILDEVERYLNAPETVSKGMELLMTGLREQRKEMPRDRWQYFCKEICLSHPIRAIVHQDPLTFRSFRKPRGYAGDAVVLDFLYRSPTVEAEARRATAIGQAILRYHTSCPSAEAVRWRRELLARMIDETVASSANAEILSVASGHLREAANSKAVAENQVKRLVAVDQDELSLKAIRTGANGANVECVRSTIKDLIRGRVKLGSFDFIYSAGLYDYLNDPAAQLLTKALFRMLKTGGRLLIANFLPGNKECGYMEAFMDWELIYRTRKEFEGLLDGLSPHVDRVFFDDFRYVVYLELRRR